MELAASYASTIEDWNQNRCNCCNTRNGKREGLNVVVRDPFTPLEIIII